MTTLAGLPCATPAIPPAVTFHECPFQVIEAAWLTCPTASARGSLHPLRRIPAKPQKSQPVNRVCIVFLPPMAPHAGSIVGLEGGRPPLSQEIVARRLEPRSRRRCRLALLQRVCGQEAVGRRDGVEVDAEASEYGGRERLGDRDAHFRGGKLRERIELAVADGGALHDISPGAGIART